MILKNYKKIVIKIGSTTLINPLSEKLKIDWLKSICHDINELFNAGKKITIENAVSSSDIAFFFFKMGVTFYQKVVTISTRTLGYGRSALVAESPVNREETFALASLGNNG